MVVSRRPVRVMPNVYGEIGGIYPNEQDVEWMEGKRPVRELDEFEEMCERLEHMSTQQLMAVARKEGANVPLRYGRGMRKRFIHAIARKRLGL